MSVPVQSAEERLLVLLASENDAKLVASQLARIGIEAHVCSGMPELVAEFNKGAGAILIMEELLQGAANLQAAIEAQHRVRRRERLRAIDEAGDDGLHLGAGRWTDGRREEDALTRERDARRGDKCAGCVEPERALVLRVTSVCNEPCHVSTVGGLIRAVVRVAVTHERDDCGAIVPGRWAPVEVVHGRGSRRRAIDA